MGPCWRCTYHRRRELRYFSRGTGEYFIRANAAYDISALMEYKQYSLKKASQKVIDRVGKLDGSGGMIAI
ncbi:MAG: isoaspartyl peptidase/L-asparaginase [Fidelibacterota bacterium]